MINICGIPHKVIEVEDDFDNYVSHFGQVDYKSAVIKICKDMSQEVKQTTLIHEILHAILVHIGEDEKAQDEKFVQTLAIAINGTFEIKRGADDD